VLEMFSASLKRSERSLFYLYSASLCYSFEFYLFIIIFYKKVKIIF